jgi:hypothetical protein
LVDCSNAKTKAMSRRAHLTIMESGASLPARPHAETSQIDDWVVIVQQADEAGAAFVERVSERARRLAREGAGICAVDILTTGRDGLGSWFSMLQQVGVPAFPEDAEPRAERVNPEEKSGIHAKPGIKKPRSERLHRTAGARP